MILGKLVFNITDSTFTDLENDVNLIFVFTISNYLLYRNNNSIWYLFLLHAGRLVVVSSSPMLITFYLHFIS
jgi:hypothetical protein